MSDRPLPGVVLFADNYLYDARLRGRLEVLPTASRILDSLLRSLAPHDKLRQ